MQLSRSFVKVKTTTYCAFVLGQTQDVPMGKQPWFRCLSSQNRLLFHVTVATCTQATRMTIEPTITSQIGRPILHS